MNKHFFEKYLNFINSCDSRELDYREITQVHHIIPKCYGGSDDVENLITLRYREHQIAHKLLSLAYPECSSLKYASNLMYSVFPMVGESNPMFGKKGSEHPSYGYIHTQEARKKMSAAKIGKTFTKEHRAKISADKTGKKRLPFSKEHRSNISAAMSGRKRPEITGDKNHNFDKTIYTFCLLDTIIVKSTQYDLKRKYNLNPGHLSKVCSRKAKSHKGWKLYNE